jgi:type I restriction enzyme S subunit
MKDKLKGLDIGSVQPSIKVTQMTKIHFLWPEQYVLEKFDSHIENLVQKIHLNETEIEALSQVRDTLLPKLLTGEIEV